MSGPPPLLVERPADDVRVLRLNRPHRRNALNTDLLRRVAAALAEAAGESRVRAVVVTGDETAFAAGADLDEIAEASPRDALTDPRLDAWSAIRTFRKPLLAAVEGHCLGGGFELALACDIIIAGAGAQFGLPEVRVGIMPGAGGTQLLPRIAGKGLAMKLVLSGQPIGAEAALRAGIATDVVAAGAALDAALELARTIAANAPFPVESAKQSVLAAFNTPLDAGLGFERARFAALQALDDKREGIAAFREKRPPKFEGR